MKKIFLLLGLLAISWSFSVDAYATLINRGTDSLGNRLIYDTSLNVTWYDFTNAGNRQATQVNWASSLAVNFNGQTLTGWRLPNTLDGPVYPWGYDGTTTRGYNITSSELGHLYYIDLGNKSFYDTNGNPQSSYGLVNTGDFIHLGTGNYWSGTIVSEYPLNAWYFNMNSGWQNIECKGCLSESYLAMAVRPGDVDPVPEPSTFLLLFAGIVGFIVIRKMIMQ